MRASSKEQARALLSQLPHAAQTFIAVARRQTDSPLYLVGGSVRDVFLGGNPRDLDLSAEADVKAIAKGMQAMLGGEVSCHGAFGTCTLTLGDWVIDLATAREEVYAHPGALPQVTRSTIDEDLARRDFALNALAVRLKPDPIDLLDPFDGMSDLKTKTIRILHERSFTDDPTRIMRGARLAGRLGFSFDDETLAQVPAALEPTILEQVSPSRLRSELELTLAEQRVTPALVQLEALGALDAMFKTQTDTDLLERLDKLRQEKAAPDESYLLALLLNVSEDDLLPLLNAYGWSRRYVRGLERLKEIRAADDLTRETWTALSDAERAVVKALSDALTAQAETYEALVREKWLSGEDVLDLGLPEGAEVGVVLAQVARARHAGEVTTFAEELELARTLAQTYLKPQE